VSSLDSARCPSRIAACAGRRSSQRTLGGIRESRDGKNKIFNRPRLALSPLARSTTRCSSASPLSQRAGAEEPAGIEPRELKT